MPQTIDDPRLDVPRKNLAAGTVSQAKAVRNPFAEALGAAIERALYLARITKQDASYRMGYGTNQAPLSRWISGTERPQFDKLWGIEGLRGPLVTALAELAGYDVTTKIEIRRTA